MEGYEPLITGLAIFFAAHLFAGFPGPRQRLISAMGRNVYRALFSLVSLAGFVLIVYGVAICPVDVLWSPPLWTQYVPLAIMPFAFLLIVGAYMSHDVKRYTRHPMLWGIALWAAGHLVANGDLGGVLLFASFLAYALVGQLLADRKMRLTDPDGWADLDAGTSAIPFAAMATGKPFEARGDFGVKVIAIAVVVFVAVLLTHAQIIGVQAHYLL